MNKGHEIPRVEADSGLVLSEAIMKNHEASVREDIRQCHTIGKHCKTERHDRLARVRSLRRVAGELVPLVVVDEDRRDIFIFLDQLYLGWSRAAAHGC